MYIQWTFDTNGKLSHKMTKRKVDADTLENIKQIAKERVMTFLRSVSLTIYKIIALY